MATVRKRTKKTVKTAGVCDMRRCLPQTKEELKEYMTRFLGMDVPDSIAIADYAEIEDNDFWKD